MFIENERFDTNLIDINSTRYLFFKYLYNDSYYIRQLMKIISENVDCLGLEYDSSNYSIVVKIKKTSMRKIYGAKFMHTPNFYYQIIPKIFKEFISSNKDVVIELLGKEYEDPYKIYEKICTNYNILSNLCIVTCLSDNIIIFKL